MAGKTCPILSRDALQDCIGEDCMLFLSTPAGGSCGLVKGATRVASKMDILSAQVQEMQVVLNGIGNVMLQK